MERMCVAFNNDLEMAETIAGLKTNVGRKIRDEVVSVLI